ncbi:TetR/AcrR family transcriptional regulator [Acerihabitans sp. KWT182]|uniref:TetR/AcrR family transcriptional regulator n=1 Tax=Acerihabitans sp. KWT182 TaxID=3157919 RepID=A0AAU7Q7V8_9GAMM
MSSAHPIITDQESEIQAIRRGRPAVPPALLLAAADALFAGSETPAVITMEAIAAAAGVGKGTLFRAFGSRDGLLDALWTAKLEPLLGAVEKGQPPFGPKAPPDERTIAFLDALLSFKLENRHLIRAREIAPQLLQSAHYQWMHGLLSRLIEEAAPGTAANETLYAAHALLATLHIDLIETLLMGGMPLQAIRSSQAAHVRTVIHSARRGELQQR